MNIVVGSAFRNAAGYVTRYMNQIEALRRHVGSEHQVRVIAVEGDSADQTWLKLNEFDDVQVVQHNHGLPWFGSIEAPERMKALSGVGNAIFDAVKETDDVLVYVESDLLWDANTIGSLIDMAMRRDENFDVFAPMVFAGEAFYDIFAFRKDGERFSPFPPYHSVLKDGLTVVDSVGSCLVMRGVVARTCRIRNDNALIGWCENARNYGYRIAVHPAFRVHHP